MRQIRALWKNDIKIPKQIAVMGKNTTLISDIVERICGVLAEDVKRAYQQEESSVFTDDASVVEHLGHDIVLVEGNRENIKITTPFDLQIASLLI